MRIAQDGNGFPSGHATGATAFYGGLAALLDTGKRARRYVTAAAMILFVSFTRLVLGVHYPRTWSPACSSARRSSPRCSR